ncbi:hypothetical protein [Streptomyces sp. NBC_00199]|uniref:hypothetical protein n=1 Tax=Streptomyces sp. NBC_00199 TaxID=2975678 RepID=UPI00225BD97D|nr:hypothetical protein [Streptomyces sp. NBC_00199]MCX5264571.1 hypothetical protein [Streptomyces sp. NBC_00199]
MSATAGRTRRSFRERAADGRRRARAVHPVRVLRWLRAGVLAMVAATALLYLLVSAQAGEQMAAARRTEAAVEDIEQARGTAVAAEAALAKVAATRQVTLIGTGTEFANDTARVNTLVTSAAAGNAAGNRGRTQFEYVQSQLTTCLQLANTAVRDYARSGPGVLDSARLALTAPRAKDPRTGEWIPGTGGLTASLTDLEDLQNEALDAQKGSRWLNPVYVRSLLVGPTAVMLVCVLATGHVVARRFRRFVGLPLVVALAATAAVGITAVRLSRRDTLALHQTPLLGHWLTTTLTLGLLAVAAVLAYLGYRPRLSEYRFPRP